MQAAQADTAFLPYTSSTLPGMGIFKTFLLFQKGYDASALATLNVPEYLAAAALQSNPQLQVEAAVVLLLAQLMEEPAAIE